jgi:hypothetical protein
MWHVFHDVTFCPLVTVLPPCDISSVCDILYSMWHVDHAVTFCPLVTLPPLTLTHNRTPSFYGWVGCLA